MHLMSKMDFGQPNAKIGQKMASGQLLFLALLIHLVSNSVGTNPQFKNEIRYSFFCSVLLFSVSRFSQQFLHLAFQIIEMIILNKNSYHLV